MAAQISTTLATLAPLITAQLAAVTGITSNRILIVQRDVTAHFQGDQDILVRFGRPVPDQGFAHGSGRVAVVVYRPLQVTPRTRWAADQSDRDDLWVTDPTYGHAALEEGVINALHIWTPSDIHSNFLTVQPIEWVPSADPLRETPVNQGWGHTDLMFQLRYQLSVTSNGF